MNLDDVDSFSYMGNFRHPWIMAPKITAQRKYSLARSLNVASSASFSSFPTENPLERSKTFFPNSNVNFNDSELQTLLNGFKEPKIKRAFKTQKGDFNYKSGNDSDFNAHLTGFTDSHLACDATVSGRENDEELLPLPIAEDPMERIFDNPGTPKDILGEQVWMHCEAEKKQLPLIQPTALNKSINSDNTVRDPVRPGTALIKRVTVQNSNLQNKRSYFQNYQINTPEHQLAHQQIRKQLPDSMAASSFNTYMIQNHHSRPALYRATNFSQCILPKKHFYPC